MGWAGIGSSRRRYAYTLANLLVQSELLARIKTAQLEDPECAKIKQLLVEGKAKEFCLKEDGLLTHFKQVCVPRIGGL